VDEDQDVPLACQTAIVKRRHRRASAGAGLARYGSWAQHLEVEAALREEDEEEEADPRSADSGDGAGSDDASESRLTAPAASRRKTGVLTAASNAAVQGSAESAAVSTGAARRPTRKSVAPSKVTRQSHYCMAVPVLRLAASRNPSMHCMAVPVLRLAASRNPSMLPAMANIVETTMVRSCEQAQAGYKTGSSSAAVRVAGLSHELSDLAAQLLPEEHASHAKHADASGINDAPLRALLVDSWQGQVLARCIAETARGARASDVPCPMLHSHDRSASTYSITQ